MGRKTGIAGKPAFARLVFAAGLAAFGWPFLAAVEAYFSPTAYLFAAWAGLIALLYLIGKATLTGEGERR